MVSAAIDDWVWRSHAIIAVSLSADGTIRAPNPALERLAARELAGVPLASLIEPSQHRALARRLAAADEQWRPAVFAFLAAGGRPSIDRRLWLARTGDELLAIGEPVTDEQERLVEKVLELNDELVATHRELVRQRSAADAAAERVGHLEAISAAGLAGRDLHAVLHDVLRVIVRAVDAESASILLREGDALVVRAALGEWQEGARVAPGDVISGLGGGMAGVPLTLVEGALQVRARAGAAFTDADLRLLTPAAERAALAISRAQLLERERGIAETLQRALLPEQLPTVPGRSPARAVRARGRRGRRRLVRRRAPGLGRARAGDRRRRGQGHPGRDADGRAARRRCAPACSTAASRPRCCVGSTASPCAPAGWRPSRSSCSTRGRARCATRAPVTCRRCSSSPTGRFDSLEGESGRRCWPSTRTWSPAAPCSPPARG